MARLILDVSGLTCFHDSSTESVLDSVTVRLHEGWTAVVGPNGSGKTTLLRLIAGHLSPAEGAVRLPGDAIYCAQRTDDPPDGFGGFLDSPERAAHALRGRLDVPEDALDRWDSLSHGERKRAQIAAALWRTPPVLLLDEPTNHVDADARRMLMGALRSFRGIGLLVSHDRELMEALCDQTLFVEGRGVDLRAGTYGAARSQREHEAEETRRRLAKERRELKRLDAEADRRKRHAEAVERGLSKSKVDRRDRSARTELDDARLRGVDKKAMGRAHQLDGRRKQVEDRIASLDARKERRTGITQQGARSRRARLLELPAGEFPMPDGRALAHPRLRIGTEDRIALTGPNGAGKTTLLGHLLDELDLPDGRLVSMPQELSREDGAGIAERVRSLPRARRGEVATVVSRLGSDPERVLETAAPSPGELRKLLLAFGLATEPWLIVMDEPTNHLDLPSVECLEETLADFPGALLLVSHDRPFLDRLTTVEWELRPTGDGVELHPS